jgi:hypothetical protein
MRSTTRSMSAEERQMLAALTTAAGGRFRRLTLAARKGFTLWAASLLVLFVVWLSVAWPARLMGGRDIGLQSAWAPWIFAVGVPLCAVYAVVAALRWLANLPNLGPSLRADLDNGEVAEESYRFTAARRFQDPEHGGLMYFLRTPEDRVFVIYDAESQELGARGRDPLASAFQAHSDLTLIRAPRSDVVISRSFAGDALDAGDPSELALPPRHWPESETYCDFAWSELEQRVGRDEQRAVGDERLS